MKNLICCFSILFLLLSCNKQNSNLKKIDGEWKIVNYARTNNEGLTTKYSSCNGTIDFVTDNGKFDLNLVYQNNGYNDTTTASGNFQLNENGSAIIISNSLGMNLSIEGNYRILTLTSTDLQIEGGDTLGNINTYLLSRK
jgi:hypothetical protein